MSVIEFLSNLNKEQQEAVKHTEGPLLIMAGAGSGKTRVLTHRIAYLIDEKAVSPRNILAITFTNKAAREMKDRVQKLVGPEGEGMWVSTFHSMCVRILRRDIERIGYSRNFTIIDSSDQQTVMKQILKNLNIDPKQYDPRAMIGQISNAKNELITPQEALEKAGNIFEGISPSSDDHLLIHGIIDGFIEYSDEIILFDFKTDYVGENIEGVVSKYKGQMIVYRQALEQIKKKKVTQTYLCLISTNQNILID